MAGYISPPDLCNAPNASASCFQTTGVARALAELLHRVNAIDAAA